MHDVMRTVTCNYPPTQSLRDPVAMVSGSQDSPPIEGQSITYTSRLSWIYHTEHDNMYEE